MPKTRGKNGEGSSDWAKSGSFINKPTRGWLHPDRRILDEGVCYEVRYVGCLEVNTSMKILNFDTRSLVAKECINRVCEAAGLKTADRKRRVDRKVSKMLSEEPNMEHAGDNIHLIITSASLELRVMESGEVIAVHDMPNISFASGGDAETLDFVAYVAKDAQGSRACYVLECGGKWAQDVITTIGQAFELRFKEYLQKNMKQPEAVLERVNDLPSGRLPDDPEYYNDLPGKVPPDLKPSVPPLPTYRACSSNMDGRHHTLLGNHHHNAKDLSPNLIDLSSEPVSPDPFFKRDCPEYANDAVCNAATLPVGATMLLDSNNHRDVNVPRDPFDMQPFEASLPPSGTVSILSARHLSADAKTALSSTTHQQLEQEEWFHGAISRKEAEALLRQDGEFLVRESQGSPGQYVLTGMQSNFKKHLLLVDPEGVVRTKDKTFESVSHLVNYHRNNGLPIISAESALVLRNPVPKRS